LICARTALALLLACVAAPPAAGQSPPAPPDPAPVEDGPAAGAAAREPEPAEEPPAPSGEGPRIGRVYVDGNVRVSDSAFFNNLQLKAGDRFQERAVFEEFRRLWDLNLFDDIAVETRQRDSTTVDLIFHVRDRPLINSVAFVGMRAVTESNILERLTQAKAEVRRGQPVDFSALRRAEAAVQQLLAEKGYLEARARARLVPTNQGQREVTFYIREGAKTKIKKIDFTGNTVFKDKRLKRLLKLTREAFWLTSWASSKTLYHPTKFDQDADNLRTAYKGLGYLDILIKP
jgi:outer membrane protein insertion porin family